MRLDRPDPGKDSGDLAIVLVDDVVEPGSAHLLSEAVDLRVLHVDVDERDSPIPAPLDVLHVHPPCCRASRVTPVARLAQHDQGNDQTRGAGQSGAHPRVADIL